MGKSKFIQSVLLIIFCFLLVQPLFAKTNERPNIVVIITDQQFADAMSCAMGNEYLNTPHMDGLAEKGVRFTKAYSPNPLCTPMRTSMITGQFPHTTGVQANGKNKLDAKKYSFMGKILKDGGYETGYFGKWHIAFDEDNRKIHGFWSFTIPLNYKRMLCFLKAI